MGKIILSLIILSLFTSEIAFSQGSECLPKMIKSEKVDGTMYLANGDSIVGYFMHLSPQNDIFTTHVLFNYKKNPDNRVSRSEIVAYKNNAEKFKRIKVFPEDERVLKRKECYFDLGNFMEVMIDGPYKLLVDILPAKSSISSYNNANSGKVYYLLTPDNQLIKLNFIHLKPQMISIFLKFPETGKIFKKESFDLENAMEVIRIGNRAMSKR